jgi:hypothetical protein
MFILHWIFKRWLFSLLIAIGLVINLGYSGDNNIDTLAQIVNNSNLVNKLKGHFRNKRQQLRLREMLQDTAMSDLLNNLKNRNRDLFNKIIRESANSEQLVSQEVSEQFWRKHIYDSDIRMFCFQGMNIEDQFQTRISDKNDILFRTINDSEYNELSIETNSNQNNLTTLVVLRKHFIDFDAMFMQELFANKTSHDNSLNKDFIKISGKSMIKDLFYKKAECGKDSNKEYSLSKLIRAPTDDKGRFSISIENIDSAAYLTDKCPIIFSDAKGKLLAIVNIR